MIIIVASMREELGDHPGHVIGLGPVVAAARTAALITRDRPDGVIMVGTGGAYDPRLKSGMACKARRVGLADGAAAMGLAYTPRPPPPLPCDPRLLARIDVPEVDVLSVGSVCTDGVLAGRLADGWQVEHLEAFGAAVACAELGVPFAAVLGITGPVGPDAHMEWLTNRHTARAAARRAVAPLFTSP